MLFYKRNMSFIVDKQLMIETVKYLMQRPMIETEGLVNGLRSSKEYVAEEKKEEKIKKS